MRSDNVMVNGLWIGTELSALELLTIKSFLVHGHRFRLWLYEPLEHVLPNGVEVMDANSVIASEEIFRYKNSNQFGHGKGSVSGFSDIFRYKLLYDHGGWWIDMDVTCLRPLDVETPYYFRPHHELLLVGNVMKCPKGSELMRRCYEQARLEVDADNTDWHKPIEILVNNVKGLKLEQYIMAGHSANDCWDEISRFLYTRKKLDGSWWFVHWMNEEWRSGRMDKNDFMIGSAYGRLLVEHGFARSSFTLLEKLKNEVRFRLKQIRNRPNALEPVMKAIFPSRRRIFFVIVVLMPLVIPFSLSEIYLRIRGDYATYSEKIGDGYVSYYNRKFSDRLWRYAPNKEVVVDHGEFKFIYHSNDFGVFEQNQFNPSDTDGLRIITLGDSFTEGMGAAYDSTWPRTMETRLQHILRDWQVQVYNAGVSGSDPVMNFMMLKEHLAELKPDLVIQAFNTSDLSDFLYRGGMERYHDGIMEFRKGPWWEVFYRYSYLVRLVVHGYLGFDPMLVKEKERTGMYGQAVKEYHRIIKERMQPFADSCGFRMLYIMQPMPDELRYDCCDYSYLVTLDSLLKRDGLESIDLFRPMQKVLGKDPAHRYDWPVDHHFNSNGYRVLGKLMADTVSSFLASGHSFRNLPDDSSSGNP